MERKRVLAAAGKLVPYMSEADTAVRRKSRDDAGKDRHTALFICDQGVWDNGIKRVIKEGPVSVPWTDYYQRQTAYGDLILVDDKLAARPGPVQPPKHESKTRGTREGAGGEV